MDVGKRCLLQVVNVCTLTGGPGAIAWTVTRALPDWRHAVLYVNSGSTPVPATMAAEFGCPLVKDAGGIDQMLREHKPEVVLYHNSGPWHVRSGDFQTVYWQHSGQRGGEAARPKCNHVWIVSKFLARGLGLDDATIVYPPVARPPQHNERNATFTVGRLCTPNARKWVHDEQLTLYGRLAKAHPDVQFEFVGCPLSLKPEMQKRCGGRAFFHEAGWPARSHLWRWHALLYHAGQSETYGLTVCEAQRCGCVPIVDAKGGFIEQIGLGRNGVLCHGVDDFERAITIVQSRFAEMSAAAQVAGDQRGDLERWADTFRETVGG